MFGRKKARQAAASDDESLEPVGEAPADAPESSQDAQPDSESLADEELGGAEESDAELEDGQDTTEAADNELDDDWESAAAGDGGQATPVGDAADKGDDGVVSIEDAADQVDWRADGPFDYDEVELGDGQRIDMGALIVTPNEHIGLQLRVDKASGNVEAVAAIYRRSALEVSLLAAPAGRDITARLRRDLAEESVNDGATVEEEVGQFGPQLRVVAPVKGKKNQFRVTRVWHVAGPRWVLRGVLVGDAAVEIGESPDEAVLAAFFRNLVVRRGNKPVAPGDLVPIQLPDGDADGRV
ncbi:MAG: DUF3710 domain-containing protein [Propionibacteriaceae bacterium]|jgi:hypothetical protein|nr:DUF3710 domain-containing protein [Propionibacteriaceae bacterium]